MPILQPGGDHLVVAASWLQEITKEGKFSDI